MARRWVVVEQMGQGRGCEMAALVRAWGRAVGSVRGMGCVLEWDKADIQ